MPLVNIYDLSDMLFSYFLSHRNIFDVASCILKLKHLFVLILSYLLLFPWFDWVIKLSSNWGTDSDIEIVKQCHLENIFLTTWPYYHLIALSYYIAAFDTHSFLLPYLKFRVFFQYSLQIINIWDMKKIIVAS